NFDGAGVGQRPALLVLSEIEPRIRRDQRAFVCECRRIDLKSEAANMICLDGSLIVELADADRSGALYGVVDVGQRARGTAVGDHSGGLGIKQISHTKVYGAASVQRDCAVDSDAALQAAVTAQNLSNGDRALVGEGAVEIQSQCGAGLDDDGPIVDGRAGAVDGECKSAIDRHCRRDWIAERGEAFSENVDRGADAADDG